MPRGSDELTEPLSSGTGGGKETRQTAWASCRKKKLLLAGGALVAAAVVAVVVVIASRGNGSDSGPKRPGLRRPSDPWPMFMRSASHDSDAVAAAATNSQRGDLAAAWVFNMSHVVSSSPTLIEDVVLAASGCGPDACAGGDLVALYRSTGTVKWSTPLGSGAKQSVSLNILPYQNGSFAKTSS
jgi:subtilisin family serine protease